MIVSEDKVHDALKYLAGTDEPCAKARAYLDGLKEQTKTVFGIEFLKHNEGTIEEKKSEAYTSLSYTAHLEKIKDAFADYEFMRNKRLTADLMIQVWRSENKHRGQGNI